MDVQSLIVLGAGFAGVALLLLILACIAGSIPVHALLYSAVWAPCLILSQFGLGGTIRPAVSTTLVLLAAWWAFLIGSIFPLITGRIREAGEPVVVRRLPALVTLFVLIALQWSGALYEILHLRVGGKPLSLATIVDDLASLRVTGAMSEIQLPPFLGSFRWSQVIYVPLAWILRSQQFISRRMLAGIYTMAVVAAFIHFTRAPVVELCILTLVSWLVLTRPSRRKFWMASASVFGGLLALFVAVQIAINAQSTKHGTLDETLSSYFGMSPMAYEDILKGGYPREPGFYSLDSFYFFLNKIGVRVTYPGETRPQIWFPTSTNVYTYLDVFTLDAGVTGAILGACLVGVGCSWAYRSDRKRSSLLTLSMYAYLCYCCLMTPINNEFIRANTLINLVLCWVATWCITSHPLKVPANGGCDGSDNPQETS
jgi:oligosaccharide repeat unit polymerase